jgi:hypothetical protein
VRVAALAAPVLVVPVVAVPAEVVAAAPVVAVAAVPVVVAVAAAPVVVVAPAAADGNGRRSNGAWLLAGAEDVILPARSVSRSHF